MRQHIAVSAAVIALTLLLASFALLAHAQESDVSEEVSSTSTSSAPAQNTRASSTAAQIINQSRAVLEGGNDTTKPEELPEKTAILTLFEQRPGGVAAVAIIYGVLGAGGGYGWYSCQYYLPNPAHSVFGLARELCSDCGRFATLDMLVPIALSFAFVAVGVQIGLLVLVAILFASYVAKRSLSNVRIMFYPKRSLSMFFLAIAVFAALSVGLVLEFERILSLSIFPILILMLLGDLIVSTQLHKSSYETLLITSTTIMLGLFGFILASSVSLQNALILYPELVFLVIPLNIMIGRYFGLRLLEVLRFSKVTVE